MKTVMRSIVCEECKLPRRTQNWFDICRPCMRKLTKVACGACAILFYRLAPGSSNCRSCAARISNIKIVCESCGITDYPFTRDPLHCRKCHYAARHRSWRKSLPREVVCVICRETKPTCKKTEMVCHVCYEKRRNSDVGCKSTGCANLISNKRWLLCSYHNMDRLAQNRLKEYSKNYRSPFPQNQRYFAVLAASGRRADNGLHTIREMDMRRYRAIGCYLKVYELPENLTWDDIYNALPDAGKYGQLRTTLIRSCLFELGNILVAQGLMPDCNSYLNLSRLGRSQPALPGRFLKHIIDFEKWASNGMLNPKLGLLPMTWQPLSNSASTIKETVNDTVAFLHWCMERQVASLSDIGTGLIAGYKETLFWRYECENCHRRTPFELGKTIEVCRNQKCNAIGSYVRVRRLAHSSVNYLIMNLRVFFNWAQLNDLVLENPLKNERRSARDTFTVIGAKGEMIEIAGSIRRYDDGVVESLCRYIVSPEADPEEALVLYLIIFHLLTVTELRNSKIPSLVTANLALVTEFDRAKDFRHLLLEQRKPTRGRLSEGRSIIKFPDKALSWLVPLLERYFEKRKRVAGSEYLFAAQSFVTDHKRPVSHRYILRLVRRTSLRVLKGTVTPRDLRRTAAAIFEQRSKRRGAILTKLGYTSPRAIRFNYLEIFPIAPTTTAG